MTSSKPLPIDNRVNNIYDLNKFIVDGQGARLQWIKDS